MTMRNAAAAVSVQVRDRLREHVMLAFPLYQSLQMLNRISKSTNNDSFLRFDGQLSRRISGNSDAGCTCFRGSAQSCP